MSAEAPVGAAVAKPALAAVQESGLERTAGRQTVRHPPVPNAPSLAQFQKQPGLEGLQQLQLLQAQSVRAPTVAEAADADALVGAGAAPAAAGGAAAAAVVDVRYEEDAGHMLKATHHTHGHTLQTRLHTYPGTALHWQGQQQEYHMDQPGWNVAADPAGREHAAGCAQSAGQNQGVPSHATEAHATQRSATALWASYQGEASVASGPQEVAPRVAGSQPPGLGLPECLSQEGGLHGSCLCVATMSALPLASVRQLQVLQHAWAQLERFRESEAARQSRTHAAADAATPAAPLLALLVVAAAAAVASPAAPLVTEECRVTLPVHSARSGAGASAAGCAADAAAAGTCAGVAGGPVAARRRGSCTRERGSFGRPPVVPGPDAPMEPGEGTATGTEQADEIHRVGSCETRLAKNASSSLVHGMKKAKCGARVRTRTYMPGCPGQLRNEAALEMLVCGWSSTGHGWHGALSGDSTKGRDNMEQTAVCDDRRGAESIKTMCRAAPVYHRQQQFTVADIAGSWQKVCQVGWGDATCSVNQPAGQMPLPHEVAFEARERVAHACALFLAVVSSQFRQPKLARGQNSLFLCNKKWKQQAL
eukprot:351893-Chlamydomonas_euryale.AAC.16